MDNVEFHHSRIVLSTISSNGLSVRFLSPYSLLLNLIEEAFSSMKEKLSADPETPGNIGLLKNKLTRILKDSFKNVDGFYSHMTEFYKKKCLTKAPIL